jgi:hypothetical protein
MIEMPPMMGMPPMKVMPPMMEMLITRFEKLKLQSVW